MAQRAADRTERAGGRLSVKSRELASELRRDTAVAKSGTGTPPLEPVDQTRAEQEAGLPTLTTAQRRRRNRLCSTVAWIATSCGHSLRNSGVPN